MHYGKVKHEESKVDVYYINDKRHGIFTIYDRYNKKEEINYIDGLIDNK